MQLIPQRAMFHWVAFCVSLAVGPAAVAEDKSADGLLANLLKNLGYEAVALKYDKSHHLIATGELEGKTRCFFIDTGCSLTAVDRQIGRKLKTLKQLGVTLEDPFFGRMTNESLALITVKLGNATFTNQPARTKTLDFGGKSMEADCILGLDFLARNFCLIDYLEKQLYFRVSAPSSKIQDVLGQSLRRGGFHEINCAHSRYALLLINATINDEPAKLLIDTGSPVSIIESKKLNGFHLNKKTTWDLKVSGIGSIGSTRLHGTKVERFELGSLSLTNMDFCVADLSGWKIGQANGDREDLDGLLGGLQLLICHGLIDCNAQKLWMRPPLKDFLRETAVK